LGYVESIFANNQKENDPLLQRVKGEFWGIIRFAKITEIQEGNVSLWFANVNITSFQGKIIHSNQPFCKIYVSLKIIVRYLFTFQNIFRFLIYFESCPTPNIALNCAYKRICCQKWHNINCL